MIAMDTTASEDTANWSKTLSSYDVAAFENCTDEVHELRKSYLPPLYGMIFFVGFLGNVVAICVYTFKMRPWKSSTIIMFNIACTDLLYLTGLPFLIHYYANGEHWVFGDFMCKFIRFGFHFNLYSSILFLTFFSILRYFAIVHPIRSFSIQKKSWVVVACVATWVISLAAVSPVNFLITSKTEADKFICLDLTSSENLDVIRWYTWLLTALAFYLPLITVTLCYTVIIYTLTTGPHTHNPHKQKARKLAVLLLVVFYVCFLPFHMFRIVRIELRMNPVSCDAEHQIHMAYVLSRPLAALNTCGNVILYAMISNNFQQAIQSLLRCKLSNFIQQTGSNSDLNKPGIILKL
ncbi:2-oxoglutarate receptor 1-like [Hemicordylus capensis]|uniref:2-oxoglutarate receptor 1-like n=1 Tax=Hemicordylus capensis TaxID=884348 RepID=UPI002302310A|nr:2-oxoglutarate receptor 1-like [Hemicordylus capensis]